MRYKARDRAVIRFDREIQPRPEIWTWLWLALALYTVLLFQYGSLTISRSTVMEDPNFLHFVVVPGCCLLIARKLMNRNYLRSLEVMAGDTLRWSATRWKRELPLHDIRLLKLYTTKYFPALAPNPEIQHSGSLHHRGGVIFIDKLSITEFQQLKGFFEAIVYANPEVELVNDITPYDPSTGFTLLGPGE
jgi:hypothetical protein